MTELRLYDFFSGAIRADVYPVPNYIILSGHGVHLYYIFERPVPLYPYLKFQLKQLKYGLAVKMWQVLSEDEGKALQGRPDKAKIVEEWQKSHPEGRKAQCIKETGLS